MASGSARHYCVPLCVSDGRYSDQISFHRIPKDQNLKKQRLIKIRRDEGTFFKITDSTVVCSKHFKPEDFKWTPVKKTLKKGVVHSIFVWVDNRPPRRVLDRKRLAPNEPDSENEATHSEAMEMDTSEEMFTATPVTADHEKELLNEELRMKTAELKRKSEECGHLQKQIEIERFGVQRFTSDNSLINFYTGFSTYFSFVTFFNIIKPSASTMQSAYYKSSETISRAGRRPSLLLIDEFFMFMCRLRAGLLEQDLSVRFNCSLATVSRKLITWVNFLYFTLGSIPLWLPKSEIQRLMPQEFKDLYPDTRVVIDCTEIRTQKPSSLVFNSQSFSNYKGANTFKCLLGVAPHGAITFISSLYTGCMSDVEITRLCGLLDLLEPGDDVMADKGFTIKKLLAERGVTINIPHFLSSKRQFSVQQSEDIENIAKLRIHIERMNRRIKENHLFDTPIPISWCGCINQLWTVACILALFKGPIVDSWGKI